ncbi:MAG: serine/threonine protein kinase, partial [Candidatus Eremiobacteraeota bacterium]|nr:serine/threonine protein kinase [Candidatus Eremiobacteraeota bacterium]
MTARRITPPEGWSQVKSIFWAVRDLPSEQRERALDTYPIHAGLRARVLHLLRAADEMGDRFERPAIESLGAERQPEWREAPSLVGRTLGAYTLVRRIGVGGMGAIYEGERRDGAFSQRVAVKTLWRGVDSEVLGQRFRSERRILASLEHPNIARLIDGGATDEGTPYLVMELVDGMPIDSYCDDRTLTITARLDLFRQICLAVQHAHRNLVVHRDLKPSNILVTSDGSVKLLDFGIAKLLDDPRSAGTLTSAGMSPFTTAYAAPEQLEGRPVSTATDVYALGAILYTLLTGRPPFDADASSGLPTTLLHRSPLRPPSAVVSGAAASKRGLTTAGGLMKVLRGDLDAITLAALREDPGRRYATVDALSADVHRHLRGERVVARPDTLSYRTRTFVRRRRATVAAIAIATIALIAGSSAALWQSHVSRLEAARSERIAQFLTRMVGSPDARTGSSFMRDGTRGSIAELLDSARVRVDDEFPDDPRVRARLYTAIGSSYMAQSRMRIAAFVLDSARILARASYGPQSDAFAEASIDAANAAVHRSTPSNVARLAHAALTALAGREESSPALYARALSTLATASYLQGDLEHTDSLARGVIRIELDRTRAATMTRAWSLRLLAGTAELRGDPRAADSLAAHAIAVNDSVGEKFSLERIDATNERAIALTALGRPAAAESLLRGGLSVARTGYGVRSREVALFLSQLSTYAHAHGDTMAARA